MDGHWTNGKKLIMLSFQEKESDLENKIKSLNLYILYTRYIQILNEH